MFGLAVTGQVSIENLKRNDRAVPGCKLFLTKPLGVGLVATAQKRGVSDQADFERAVKQMTTLNNLGTSLGSLTGVKAMTDVSGFGLLGHLTEMCEGSGVSASLDSIRVPRLKNIDRYIDQGCTSGGTDRNFDSYGQKSVPSPSAKKPCSAILKPAAVCLSRWLPMASRPSRKRVPDSVLNPSAKSSRPPNR